MPTPHGVDILFLLCLGSAVTLGFWSFQGKVFNPICTKFGMGVYWVNSLHEIDFESEDGSIAN